MKKHLILLSTALSLFINHTASAGLEDELGKTSEGLQILHALSSLPNWASFRDTYDSSARSVAALNAQLATARGAQASLQSQVSQLQSQVAEVPKLRGLLVAAQTDTKATEEKRKLLESAQADLQKKLAAATAAGTKTLAERAALETERDALKKRVTEETLAKAAEVTRFSKEKADIERQLADLTKQQSQAGADKQALGDQKIALGKQLATVTAAEQKAVQALAQLQASLKDAESRLATATAAQMRAEDAERVVKKAAEEAADHLSRLRALTLSAQDAATDTVASHLHRQNEALTNQLQDFRTLFPVLQALTPILESLSMTPTAVPDPKAQAVIAEFLGLMSTIYPPAI